jgi:hypothetical protein
LLEGRRDEDVFPTRYEINTEARVREIAAQSGFEVLELRMLSSTAITAMIPPLAFGELLLIRLMEGKIGRRFRSNIIAVLRKRGVANG